MIAVASAGCATTQTEPPQYPAATWSADGDGVLRPTMQLVDNQGQTCNPDLDPNSAEGFAAWMGGLNGLPGWKSADVGASTRLVDGRVLWVFGDTSREAGYVPRMASSSLLVTRGSCTSQVIDDQEPFLPNEPGSVCWPSAMASRPSGNGDEVWVSCSRIERTGSGIFDFRYLGLSIGYFTVGRGGVPSAPTMTAVTSDLDDPTQINWGAALMVRGDTLYVYGTRDAVGEGAGRRLVAAMVPADRVTDRSHWRYWDGDDWSASERDAETIIPSAQGVSQALTVHRIGERYVVVSKKGGDARDTVGLWVGPTPTGPFSLKMEVPLPYDEGNGIVTYQPLAHPEFMTASGDLLVSYSRNPRDLNQTLANPQDARPGFLEVPFR